MSNSEGAEYPELVLRGLIIDDESTEASLYGTILQREISGRILKRQDAGPGHRFELYALVPFDGESQDGFGRRLLEFISGNRLTNLVPCGSVSGTTTEGHWLDFHIAFIDARLNTLIPERAPLTGEMVSNWFRHYRPNTLRVLLTNHQPEESALDACYDLALLKGNLVKPASASACANNICSKLCAGFTVPTWSGLKEYANADKIVMHAMAMSDARSIGTSTLTAEFFEYLGENAFFTEASLTLPPLDSLLSPSGCILESMKAFAGVFGAKDVVFGTNGTSTANKIAIQALTSPGDVVFLDRNCHISHHYGSLLHGLNTYFLNPPFDEGVGLPTNVTPRDLYEQSVTYLEAIKVARGAIVRQDIPTLVTVTNCSFDGFVIRPNEFIEHYMQALEEANVASYFAETAFLFDEAWFGFARFYPSLIEFTAMGADYSGLRHKGLPLRIYATCSIHKTLSALRQASVLLINDSKLYEDSGFREAMSVAVRQAVSCFTTTSPNIGIVASMDLARCQMFFEGTHLVDGAVRAAESFRNKVRSVETSEKPFGRYFKLMTVDGYEAAGLGSDPTKVTLLLPYGLVGARVKRDLWEYEKVQVNKFGPHSILFMFMIGATDELVSNLMIRLNNLAKKYSDEGVEGGAFPVKAPGLTHLDLPCDFVDEGGRPSSYMASVVWQSISAGRRCLYDKHFGKALSISLSEVHSAVASGDFIYTCAGFVVPYPPGFPTLVPGQLVSAKDASSLLAMEGQEIHGLTKDDKGKRCLPLKQFPVV